jgi:hypothetical protein
MRVLELPLVMAIVAIVFMGTMLPSSVAFFSTVSGWAGLPGED